MIVLHDGSNTSSNDERTVWAGTPRGTYPQLPVSYASAYMTWSWSRSSKFIDVGAIADKGRDV